MLLTTIKNICNIQIDILHILFITYIFTFTISYIKNNDNYEYIMACRKSVSSHIKRILI